MIVARREAIRQPDGCRHVVQRMRVDQDFDVRAHFERDWADSLMRQPRTGPERSLVVSGVYDRWIEPRGRSYARLELEIQPADQFEVAASPTAALDRVHELFGPEWLMYVG